MPRYSPRILLFPYTTLFRSDGRRRAADDAGGGGAAGRGGSRRLCDRRRGSRAGALRARPLRPCPDRKSTRLNSSHLVISYAVFCLKKKNKTEDKRQNNRINK